MSYAPKKVVLLSPLADMGNSTMRSMAMMPNNPEEPICLVYNISNNREKKNTS